MKNLIFIIMAFYFSVASVNVLSCVNCSENSDTYGRCSILMPRQSDKAGHYCDNGRFGVAYNGYFVSGSCYSDLKRAIAVMKTTNACLMEPNYGKCKILYPNKKDKTNKHYCDNGKFGVTYNGYFINSNCYSSIDRAMAIMQTTSSCWKPDSIESCQILYPYQKDLNGNYCDKGKFGVVYKGYFINSNCYSTIDRAMSVLENFVGY